MTGNGEAKRRSGDILRGAALEMGEITKPRFNTRVRGRILNGASTGRGRLMSYLRALTSQRQDRNIMMSFQ